MNNQEIEQVSTLIKDGACVILPGDTVYGISCDATNAEAVQKVIDIKGRDKSKSFIILVDSDAMLERYVKEVPEIAWELIDSAVDPLTIVFPEAVGLATGVAAQDGSIAIRITSDELSKKLIRKIRRPLLSTSANTSGKPTPLSYSELEQDILDRVDHVVTSAAPKGNKPSSIIRIGLSGEIDIIRK